MEEWTARQVAAHAGIAEEAGRDLVRRLKLDAVGRDMATGAKLYSSAQAAAAIAARPGRGSRTDRGHRRRPLTDPEQHRLNSRRHLADKLEKRAREYTDRDAIDLMTATAAQLRRLADAGVRHPAYAFQPSGGHARLYDIADELARQIPHLASNLNRTHTDHGARRLDPATLTAEGRGLLDRLVHMVDRAATGQPLPER